MSKIQKILIAIGLVIIVILSARLITHKEKVYTAVAEVQLLRDDPELKKQEIEALEDEITLEQKNQDYIQNNHNHSTK